MLDGTKYTLLFEKDRCKIFGCVEKDTTTGRYSALIGVEEANGESYEPVTVAKDKFVKKGVAALEFLYGYSMELDQEDLKRVRDKLMELFRNPGEIVEVADRQSEEEVLEALADFIRRRNNGLVSIDGKMIIASPVFTKKGYGYIETKEFQAFFSENRDLGWHRLEVLKMLKRDGLLSTGKGRVYDKKVRVNEKCRNCYVVKMPEDVTNDADETISIEEVGDENEG